MSSTLRPTFGCHWCQLGAKATTLNSWWGTLGHSAIPLLPTSRTCLRIAPRLPTNRGSGFDVFVSMPWVSWRLNTRLGVSGTDLTARSARAPALSCVRNARLISRKKNLKFYSQIVDCVAQSGVRKVVRESATSGVIQTWCHTYDSHGRIGLFPRIFFVVTQGKSFT